MLTTTNKTKQTKRNYREYTYDNYNNENTNNGIFSKNPVLGDGGDDAYNDPRFISLDMETLNRFLRIYEKDNDIQTYSQSSLNHALAGGVLFTRKNKMLPEESKDWHNQIWSGWVKQVEKMLFCHGFCIASCKPHPKYGAEPTVLSMDHIDIRYHLDVHGVPTFRVFEKLDAIDMIINSNSHNSEQFVFGRQPITNIRWWIATPPTRTGAIRSSLMTLLNDIMYEAQLMHLSSIADRARANPPMVTQRIPQQYKAGAISSSAPSLLGGGNGSRFGNGTAPDNSNSTNTAYHNDGQNLVELMRTFDSESLGSMSSKLERMMATRINNSAYEQVYLEDGRQLVQQVIATPPHDILLAFKQAISVRVALKFGQTIPALTQPPKGLNTSEIKKSGDKGASNDGSNSIYFETHQREMKQRFIFYIHEMYTFIHTPQFALDEIREAQQTKTKLNPTELRDAIKVEVSLPSVPEDNTLHALYSMGILKHESFINYISSKHSIPIEAFESKPVLTVQERNGIVEKPVTEPAKKSKTKA